MKHKFFLNGQEITNFLNDLPMMFMDIEHRLEHYIPHLTNYQLETMLEAAEECEEFEDCILIKKELDGRT